eukprot:3246045-Ditylum_brightwellii.AAC.1
MLFHGVDGSVDGGDKHLTHLTQAVHCCLKARMEEKACSLNAMISRSVSFGSANSTEDGVDDSVDDSVDGGHKHLTHLTQAVHCCLKA